MIQSGRQEKATNSFATKLRSLVASPPRPPVDSRPVNRYVALIDRESPFSTKECLLPSMFDQVLWETSFRAIKTVNTCSDNSHAQSSERDVHLSIVDLKLREPKRELIKIVFKGQKVVIDNGLFWIQIN